MLKITVATGDRIVVNGREYTVGELPWPKAQHRAVLELLTPREPERSR